MLQFCVHVRLAGPKIWSMRERTLPPAVLVAAADAEVEADAARALTAGGCACALGLGGSARGGRDRASAT